MDYAYHYLQEKHNEKYYANKKSLKKMEDYPLTNHDIDNILKGQTKVLTYKQLPQFKNINQLLEPYKNFIMLYLAKPNYGHWTCVLKHPDRIEFFDPYGGNNNIPDTVLDKIDVNVRNTTNQNYPYLSRLLDQSRYPIEYNNYQFQQHKSDIKTCGRHCIVRVLFKNLLLDDYYKLMTSLCHKLGLNYDQLVTLITENY